MARQDRADGITLFPQGLMQRHAATTGVRENGICAQSNQHLDQNLGTVNRLSCLLDSSQRIYLKELARRADRETCRIPLRAFLTESGSGHWLDLGQTGSRSGSLRSGGAVFDPGFRQIYLNPRICNALYRDQIPARAESILGSSKVVTSVASRMGKDPPQGRPCCEYDSRFHRKPVRSE